MSEYLSEEEQMERLRSWWRDYGLWLLLGLLVAAGGYFGWQWFESARLERSTQASALYQSYLDAGEDVAKQDAALKAIEDVAKGEAYHTFVLLRRAGKAIETGELESAETLLREVSDNASDSLLRNLAMLRLAAVLQGLDRTEEALKLLDQVSGAGYRGLALELKGDIHMARGQRAEAHAAYSAAFAALDPGEKDPLLEAKVSNSASPAGRAATPAAADATPDDEADTADTGASEPAEDEAAGAADASPVEVSDSEAPVGGDDADPASGEVEQPGVEHVE